MRRQQSIAHCEKVVACLVEQLLKTEEGDCHPLTGGKGTLTQKSTIADIIVAIAFFCEAHPPFVTKHLKTLLPYLKGDANLTSELSSLVSLKVTEILSSASSLGDVCVGYDVAEVVSSLMFIALNYSNRNVHAAIHCLTLVIANVSEDATPLYQLADKCFRALQEVASSLPPVNPAAPSTHSTTSDNTTNSGTSNSGIGDSSSGGNSGNNSGTISSTTGNSGTNSTTIAYNWLVPTNKAQVDRLQRCLIVLGYLCEHVKKCYASFRSFGAAFPTKIEAFIAATDRRRGGGNNINTRNEVG